MKTLRILLFLFVCLPAFAQLPISVRSTNGTAVDLTVNGTIGGTAVVPVANGGTSTNAARGAGQNIALYLVSPTTGNNPVTDFTAATPAFEGQAGMGRFSSLNYFLRIATSTSTGAWFNSVMSLPPIQEFGDDSMDTAGISFMNFRVNTGAAGHTVTGDSGIAIYNYSTNANNSGSSYILPITDAANNVQDSVGFGFTWTPVNRIPSLLPGNGTINFNTSANMKGFGIVSPTIGPDSGNYSLFFTDPNNILSGVPFWTQGAYQPSDVSYALTVSGISVTPNANDGNTVYSNNGHNYVLSVVSLSGSAPSKSGTIILTAIASSSPTASGTLTKVSGTGDATIAFSAVVTSPWRWALQVSPSTGVVTVPSKFVATSNLTVGTRQWNSAAFPDRFFFTGAVDPNSTLVVSNASFSQLDTAGVLALDIAGNGTGFGYTGPNRFAMDTWMNGTKMIQYRSDNIAAGEYVFQLGSLVYPLTGNTGSMGTALNPWATNSAVQGNFNQLVMTNSASAGAVITEDANGRFIPSQTPNLSSVGATTGSFTTLNSSGTTTLNVLNTTSIVVGASTNVASFTLVNTNWVSGKLNTNNTGRIIHVICPCQITMTGVAGAANFSLVSAGNTTNALAQSTLITSLATSLTNEVSGYIANGGVFTFTNLSTGTGDSGGPVNGGQYMVF